MHINQQARLAANQLRKGRPNQSDRFRIAGILEDIATQFEEMESNNDAKRVAKKSRKKKIEGAFDDAASTAEGELAEDASNS